MAQLISLAEARHLWFAELRKHGPRGWHTSKLARVMFDYCPQDGPTAYDPAPAWPTIADRTGHAPRDRYLTLQQRLIEQGYRFSDAGGRHSGTAAGLPLRKGFAMQDPRTVRTEGSVGVSLGHQGTTFVPLPISFQVVIEVISAVMANTHPAAVRQEQILRTSFMTRLPQETAAAVGTFRSAVHPEMPTPSNTYQRTGQRAMRARYDLGFGPPEDPHGIVGVMELKAGLSSFDGRFGEGFAADFEKLLDPRLPPGAFRVSWALALQPGRAAADDVARRAASALANVEARLGLSGRATSVASDTGWLTWRWPSGQAIHLAWYCPSLARPDHFVCIWRR